MGNMGFSLIQKGEWMCHSISLFSRCRKHPINPTKGFMGKHKYKGIFRCVTLLFTRQGMDWQWNFQHKIIVKNSFKLIKT